MSHFADFAAFMQMDSAERESHITDLLADLAEVWMDDDADSIMVRGMVASFRAMLDSANELGTYMEEHEGAKLNQYVGGLYANIFRQTAKHYGTLAGITDVKREFMKGKE